MMGRSGAARTHCVFRGTSYAIGSVYFSRIFSGHPLPRNRPAMGGGDHADRGKSKKKGRVARQAQAADRLQSCPTTRSAKVATKRERERERGKKKKG